MESPRLELEIIPGAADFYAVYCFTEIFSEMSCIARDEMVCSNGHGRQKHGTVFLRQRNGTGQIEIDLGNDDDARQTRFEPFQVFRTKEVPSCFFNDIMRHK